MVASPDSGQPVRLLEVLQKAEGFLRERGSSTPRLDAQLLLAHVLGCDRVRLYLDFEKPLREEELGAFRSLVRRRANREPLAYILGQREFWSLAFKVDPRALIPRPDSETLVEEAARLFAVHPPTRIADIGTGSGCLAAALASLFPHATGVAVDVDPEALALARENLAMLGIGDRIETREGHLLEPLAGETFDLIAANLPYIPSGDLPRLPPDVLFEPRRALDGGPDGLALIREIVASVRPHLRPGGVLLLEVGAGQAETVRNLCAVHGKVHTRQDTAGIERVVALAA